nr:integrase, catalytic region, zinc finger, CCHC-type, peptidase aspartic, catalytic [Tanacetum cinerariifolium]
MSRDVLPVGSTMRIPLLYRGEYSKWVERFMNYLEEQTDGEAMINSIKNGDQPLPHVTQVSIAGTTSTEQPPLKDKSMWSDQEKRIQKIDRLARSLLIQGLSNDIYSLIDSNKTAKDLWDALARHMLGSESVINDLRKCSYSKDNCELNFKFLNNLQLVWKQYATMMRHNKNLMDIKINALYNILKQNQRDVNDAVGSKKKTVVVTYDPLALIAEKTNVSRSKEKVVVSSNSEGNFENQNKDFQDKYDVLKNQTTTFEMNNKELNEQLKELIEKNNDLLAQTKLLKDQLQVKHVVINTHVECQEKYAKLEAERYKYMIKYSAYFDNDKQHRKQIADQQVLYDKMSVQLVELDKHVRDLKNTVLEKDFKISELEEYNLYNGRKGIGFENPRYFEKAKDLRPTLYDEKVIGLGYTPMFLTHSDEALEIEKFKRSRENEIEFAYDYENLNASYQTSSLRPYVSNVILEKIIIDLEDEVVNLLEKEKEKYAKLKAKRYEYMIRYSAYFDNDKQHRKQIADQQVFYDKMSVQLVELDKHVRYLKNTLLEKDFKIFELEECVRNKDLEIEKCFERLNVCENKIYKMGQINQTLHMIMPSKDNLYNGRKGIGFENSSYFEKAKDLRPTLYDEKVIGLGVNWSRSRPTLYDEKVISLGYTPMFLTHSDEALEIEKFKRSRENKIEFAYDYGNLNASYVNEKINFEDDYFQDIINLDFEKIDSPFKQTSSLKPYVSNVILEKIIIDLEDEVICLWIIDSGCSKHMTGNRALLTNFVEKFLRTVRFGNIDFAVIAGYRDVVIGSMTIKKVYYVEGLGL